MGSKKKEVVLKPFDEVAFESLVGGRESEAYKQFEKWADYGQDAILAAVFYLTRSVVPEAVQNRIVPALIAASRELGDGDEGGLNRAIASGLTHFSPGKRGLKQLWQLLSVEYLKTNEDSDESENLEGLFSELLLDTPERPKKEEPPPVKAASKKPAKSTGNKKPAAKK